MGARDEQKLAYAQGVNRDHVRVWPVRLDGELTGQAERD